MHVKITFMYTFVLCIAHTKIQYQENSHIINVSYLIKLQEISILFQVAFFFTFKFGEGLAARRRVDLSFCFLHLNFACKTQLNYKLQLIDDLSKY